MLVWGLIAAASTAQPPEPPPPVAGLILELESLVDGARDARVTRLPALYVAEGDAASPLLPPGPFRATWRGWLNLDIRTRIEFTVEGRGSVRLQVEDDVIFDVHAEDFSKVPGESKRVRKGASPFVLTYVSPETGAAQIRLLWEARALAREPVPPWVFTHAAGPQENVARGQLVRRGLELVAERRCLACHRSGDRTREDLARGVPELAAGAPALDGIGSRLEPAWMLEWIQVPRRLRPTARMPKLFHHPGNGGSGPEDDPRARDVAAWLASLTSAEKSVAAVEPSPELVRAGGELFADLGCIACHVRPGRPAEPADDPDLLPLSEAPRKFRPGELAAFLRAPDRFYPWVRMPDFGLTATEAAALEAWIRAQVPAEASPAPELGDPARGLATAQALGCLHCHQVAGVEAPPLKAPGLSAAAAEPGLDRGCLAGKPSDRGAPDFGFTPEAVAALRAVMAGGPEVLGRRSPAEAAERQMHELRCQACHVIDVELDHWSRRAALVRDLEPARTGQQIGQMRPSLTHAGAKLQTTWMEALLKGELKERTRPWLRARMPAFRARAEILPVGLAALHGVGPSAPVAPEPDPGMIKTGAFLASREGFGCTACHALQGEPPYARFEVGAIDFALVHERLRPDHYRRWVFDPRRFDPGSRMPTYHDDEGKTQFMDIYEGDARRQFEAIWRYFATLR